MKLLQCCSIFFLLSCNSSKKMQSGGDIVIKQKTESTHVKTHTDSLREKYAVIIGKPPGEITNTKLYQFVDDWLNTPYRWGGDSRSGIDCSAFMQRFLSSVYGINMPRTSIDQFFTKWVDRFGASQYLSEGDLVFFRTENDKLISHVGLYLGNRMFVNAASSRGVSISSLDEPYWKSRFVAAGRVKTDLLPRP